jgi:hypothetical protein
LVMSLRRFARPDTRRFRVALFSDYRCVERRSALPSSADIPRRALRSLWLGSCEEVVENFKA